MDNKPQTGVFGKLPLHGDFIYRNLPNNCMNAWDEWLQRYIAGSREQLSNEWLDIYLTSPIWRFAMSEGVLDESAWIGMIVPSVDRVGRYFPISVLSRVPTQANLFEYLMLQTGWFKKIEECLLDALDAQLDVDELMTAIEGHELNQHTAYEKVQRLENHSSAVISMEFEEQSSASVYPHFLDAFLSLSLASFSVWITPGSERVEPCMSITQGLPKIGGIASMLDGQWSYWNWQQPYNLKLSESMKTDHMVSEHKAPELETPVYNAPDLDIPDPNSSNLDISDLDTFDKGTSNLIIPDDDFLDNDVLNTGTSDFDIIDNDVLDNDVLDTGTSDFNIIDNDISDVDTSD